jgi:hypothetical protein
MPEPDTLDELIEARAALEGAERHLAKLGHTATGKHAAQAAVERARVRYARAVAAERARRDGAGRRAMSADPPDDYPPPAELTTSQEIGALGDFLCACYDIENAEEALEQLEPADPRRPAAEAYLARARERRAKAEKAFKAARWEAWRQRGG